MGCNQSSDGTWPVQGPVDRATIEEYLQLERQIADAEHSSPVLVLQQKRHQIEQLEERIKIQEGNFESLHEVTPISWTRPRRESSKSFWTPRTKRDQLVRNPSLMGEDVDDDTILEDEEAKHRLLLLSEDRLKEKREALAAFNNKEICKAELDGLKEQVTNTINELKELEDKATNLQDYYKRQDELLARIFGGEYGSPEENMYEQELDQHEEMRNRIVEANFKWRQAQLMVDYAFKQLNEGVRNWLMLMELSSTDLETRYSIASVARNNLVASAQNITGAQRYLDNVQFPYCAPSEVATLNKATMYVFTDMQTPDRHQHALDCYSTTAKRCGALLQWINQVVNSTIAKDLDEINEKVKASSFKLRTERVKLIKIKAKELTGEDVDIEVSDINTDINVDLNLNDLVRTDGIDPQDPSLVGDLTIEELEGLDNDELAPPPSKQDIFGQVDKIKTQYQEENEKLAKQFAENEMRQKNALKQELLERRQRRARKNLEEKEKEHLTS